MSRLSNAVNFIKNAEWENIATKCARAILDLEFDVDNSTTLTIRTPVYDGYDNKGNVVNYWARVDFNKMEFNVYDTLKFEKPIATSRFEILEADGEVVDIGELKFYIEQYEHYKRLKKIFS